MQVPTNPPYGPGTRAGTTAQADHTGGRRHGAALLAPLLPLLLPLLLLFPLLLALPRPAHGAERAPGAAAPPARLTVAMDDNYPPYIFRDTKGELQGYLVDAWALWSRKTGVPVELLATDWDLARQNMASGRANVIDTIFKTPERERTLDFTAPYADIPVSIYARADIGGIANLQTLHGFVVGVKAGDNCASIMANAGTLSQEAYPNYEALIQAAIAGKIPVFCLDEPPANYLLYRDRAETRFHKAFQLYTGQFRRAVHKGDAATMGLLERGFALMAPVELQAMHDKWMGIPLHRQRDYSRYLGYVVVGAVAIGAILVVWGFALRRVAAQRTGQLNTERTRLRTLVQAIPDLIWVKDKDGAYLSCNPSFERFFGAPEAAIVGKTDYDFVARDLADFFREHDRRVMTSRSRDVSEEWMTFADNNYRGLFEIVKTPMYDNAGALVGVLGVARDITLHHEAEEKLRASENFFQTLALVNPVGIFRTDAQGHCIFVNQRWCDISGLTEEQAMGDGWSEGIFSGDRERVQTEWQASVLEHRPFGLEYRFQQPAGKLTWVYGQSVATLDGGGQVSGYVGTVTDITHRKSTEDEIRYLAFYDSLTHLPNRRLLRERLHQAIVTHRRNGQHGAVLFIDLDNFKTLNDTSGHDKGDLLLQQVAPLLSGCVRDADTVARLGGDEFVVLLEALHEQAPEAAAEAETVGEKLLAALDHNFMLDAQEYHSTASIGITLFGRQNTSVDDLLKQADLAMYQSKLAGRNTLRFFDPEMQATISGRLALEADIRKGLQEHQFLLYYQPQMGGAGQVIGAEALLRWQHPQRGMVAPGDFIPLAEETGLILPLGSWVLEAACRQLVAWAAVPASAALTLAVNVSPRQFRQPDFVAHVIDIVRRSGADPRKLKLELTESLLLDDVEDTIVKMTALKQQGVGFSLDDFGTGYSSLSYLKRLPLDQIKIDQSFVRDILDNPDDAVIARTIITLGHSLGLAVIAEGVELEAQHRFLAVHGCNAFQGYLFGRPVACEQFEQFLQPG